MSVGNSSTVRRPWRPGMVSSSAGAPSADDVCSGGASCSVAGVAGECRLRWVASATGRVAGSAATLANTGCGATTVAAREATCGAIVVIGTSGPGALAIRVDSRGAAMGAGIGMRSNAARSLRSAAASPSKRSSSCSRSSAADASTPRASCTAVSAARISAPLLNRSRGSAAVARSITRCTSVGRAARRAGTWPPRPTSCQISDCVLPCQ
jgi:hypothetical protein